MVCKPSDEWGKYGEKWEKTVGPEKGQGLGPGRRTIYLGSRMPEPCRPWEVRGF